MEEVKFSKKQLTDAMWRRGILKHRCHSVQKEMYDTFYSSKENSTLVWLLARQSGKSFLLAILALEQALRNPNGIVKVLTDTKVHMENIFIPIMNEILLECPEDMKPEYSKQKFTYTFSNGAQIQLAGSDGGNYERLRGQKAVLCLVDEAGFCDSLSEVIKSVLIPTTTHTGGRIVLASTPPTDYDHDFIRSIEEAQLRGYLTKKTIYDNPLLTKEQVSRIEEEMGGANSDQFRREYKCELIKDASRSVIPEASEELIKEITKDVERPKYYDSYVSMDLGWNDLTVVLFGYYDFKNDVVVIEDELVTQGRDKDFSIKKLTKDIMDKEKSLWTNPLTHELKPPYRRVSDINPIVTNEISINSGYELNFHNPQKDDKQAAINTLRAMIGAKKILINPRCTVLPRHLINVKYHSEKNKKEFARSPDDGHYDAVDALIYFIRSIIYTKNPYPAGWNLDKKDLFINNTEPFLRQDPKFIYQQIFGRKKVR